MDILLQPIFRWEPGSVNLEAATPKSLLTCGDGFFCILVTNLTSETVSLNSHNKLGSVAPHNVAATTYLLLVEELPYHGTDLPWEEFNFRLHLASEQKRKLNSVHQKFRHVIALCSVSLGHTTLTSHIIDTGITLPIR